MQLIDLPAELLSSLPLYIRNIEDFTEFSSTCRAIYNAFSITHPNTILRLAAASAPTFFHPHPYFLVMATARQVSDWARGNPDRTEKLHCLLELCLSVAGLKLEDIRRLHLARFSIINPLSDAIDKMAGEQWYATPNFWNGGVSEAYTIDADADRAAFQIIIYGELFGSSMNAFLDGEPPEKAFDLQVRLDYIKYCIPDWICEGGYEGLEVLDVGPYAPGHSYAGGDQVALDHILGCARWKRLWAPVHGPEFAEEWKQRLWKEAVQVQGLAGMEVMTGPGGLSKWTGRLEEIRGKIERLGEKDRPVEVRIGRAEVQVSANVPDLHREIYVCCRKMWPGTENWGLGAGGSGSDGEDEEGEDEEQPQEEERKEGTQQ
ncbi:hypothetical protein V5O48_009537 [Marasmius crinis-equi]|uniref:F-box domain-containing protein n=1 Tax=Marasmius crinis-equi TaxID=585013 RepID=A0ABR3FAY1_9AGAR